MSTRARNFFMSTVRPTVDEFLHDESIRKGRIAAILLNQMTDYYALEGYVGNNRSETEKLVGNVRDELCRQYPAFSKIGDIANAIKHVQLHQQIKRPRQLHSTEQVACNGFGLFEVPFGEGQFSESLEIIVTFDNGECLPLKQILHSVLQVWEDVLKLK